MHILSGSWQQASQVLEGGPLLWAAYQPSASAAHVRQQVTHAGARREGNGPFWPHPITQSNPDRMSERTKEQDLDTGRHIAQMAFPPAHDLLSV